MLVCAPVLEKWSDMMSNLFWLNEAQMARFRPLFPKSHGRRPCR